MDISNIKVNKQNSILIDADKKIFFDPFEILTETHDADIIFITHDHYDHYSVDDINKIKNDKTVFIVPAKMEKSVKKNFPDAKVICVIPGEKYEKEGLYFETVPSYNKVKPFHPKKSAWCGYVVVVDGMRIYVAGDTDATKEAEAVKCDIALVPIGGTFTMNYKEAAALINKMRPKYAIPTHYGSIVGSKSDGDDFKKLVDDGISVEIVL